MAQVFSTSRGLGLKGFRICSSGLSAPVKMLSGIENPKGPCTQIVYTLAPKYLNRDYIEAIVYTIWVHGPLAYVRCRVGGLVRTGLRVDLGGYCIGLRTNN